MTWRRLAATTAAAFLSVHACQVYDESDLEEGPDEPEPVITGGRPPTGGATFVPVPNAGSGGVATGGAASRGGGGSGGRGGAAPGASGGLAQTSGRGGSDPAPGGDAGFPGGANEPGTGGAENPGGQSDPGGGGPANGGSGGVTGGAATGGAATGGVPVSPELIDDGDDGNNQLRLNQERNGYWATFGPVACNNTPTNTMATMFMTATAAGSGTGLQALQFISHGGEEDSCGVGFDFVSPKGLYDAGDYTGISFGARSASGSQVVLVKVSTAGTDPKFGFCDDAAGSGSGEQCYDHFLASITVTSTWDEYSVSFDELMQEGWGFEPPDGFDTAELVGIQWTVKPGTANLWIDDVKFVE